MTVFLIKIAKVCIYVNYRVTPSSNRQFDLIIDHSQIKHRLINLRRILARTFLASNMNIFLIWSSWVYKFVPWEKGIAVCGWQMATERECTPLVMIAIVIEKERTGGIEVTFPWVYFLHERWKDVSSSKFVQTNINQFQIEKNKKKFLSFKQFFLLIADIN